MGKDINYNTVTLQCYRNGKPGTIIVVPNVVAVDDDGAKKRAMRDRKLKDGKTVKYKLIKVEQTKTLGETSK